jgi:sugar-specific transcriptional regulator TrmB
MSYLNKLGLNKYEEEVYLALIKEGKSNSKKIAEISKVPITAVYPALNSLITKRLVFKVDGEISFFQATDPKVALTDFANKKSLEVQAAGKEAADFVLSIKQNNPISLSKELVSLSTGIEASHAITEDFVKNAKKSVYIFGWRFRSSKSMYKILNLILSSGIDIRIIMTSKDIKYKDVIAEYKKAGVKIKYFPADNFSIIVCDSIRCKLTLKSEQLNDRYNILIEDKDLSKAMNEYFLTTWKKAKEF